jgi:hypothetical protein
MPKQTQKHADEQLDKIFEEPMAVSFSGDHSKLSGRSSTLINVHANISNTIKAYLSEYDHRVHGDYVEDVYVAAFDSIEITIILQTFSLAAMNKKRIPHTSSPIGFHTLCDLFARDWNDRNANPIELTLVQSFLNKMFTQNSDSCLYMTEFDTSYWGMVYLDPKANTSVDISIVRSN